MHRSVMCIKCLYIYVYKLREAKTRVIVERFLNRESAQTRIGERK